MEDNIINFPVKQFFERDVFDNCQNRAKEIASKCVEESESLEDYALSLAMACGHALSFVRDQNPEEWENIGAALEVIAHGGGLSYEKQD